jgi:hypothetical protein
MAEKKVKPQAPAKASEKTRKARTRLQPRQRIVVKKK